MKKLLAAVMSALLISASLTGCASTASAKSPEEPPKITISIGDDQLDYVVAKNKWDGAVYDREDTFKTILKNSSEKDIPYVEIGKTATISFADNPPDEFTIMDILIDETGKQRYTHKEIINIPVELKDGKGSFEIKKHMASGLSSYYEQGKTDIRGFRMIASWGENECEYAFIIKTDAF